MSFVSFDYEKMNNLLENSTVSAYVVSKMEDINSSITCFHPPLEDLVTHGGRIPKGLGHIVFVVRLTPNFPEDILDRIHNYIIPGVAGSIKYECHCEWSGEYLCEECIAVLYLTTNRVAMVMEYMALTYERYEQGLPYENRITMLETYEPPAKEGTIRLPLPRKREDYDDSMFISMPTCYPELEDPGRLEDMTVPELEAILL